MNRDSEWETDRKAMTREIFATLPGFEWCGGCGFPPRPLTDDEAEAIIRSAREQLLEAPALMVLESLAFVLETHMRTRVALCSCPAPPPPSVVFGAPTRGFHMYRLWGANERLLYVGVSRSLYARLCTHVRKWGDLIATITWEEFETAAEMLEAERVAIRDEYPAFNVAGS